MKKILFLTFLNLLFTLPVYASIKVAVMPFEVLSKNPDIKQFGLGTTDTLTNALGSIPDFVMVDRGQLSTIMKEQAFQQSGFTNADESIKLGKILNIELLVVGSIQDENNMYRITARFTDVATAKVVKSIQVTGNSIFNLQDQLATELINSQKILITPQQKTRIEDITKATINVAAYDYYTKGRTEYFRQTEIGFRNAINYFDQALNVDKTYTLALASKSEAQALLAYELKKNGMDFSSLLKESENNASEAIRQKDDLAESHRALSIVYSLIQKHKEGQVEAQKAITLNPNDAEAYISLWINNKFNPEDPNIHKAIALNPYLAPAYNNLGLAYSIRRKYDLAISNFQQAIKVNPEYVSSYLNLGLLYQQQNKSEEAISYFQQAIKVNPNYAFAYYHLGNIYNEQNNLDQSIIQLNKAIVINPNFYSAMINLANIYNKQQNFKEATNMFKNILKIKPNDEQSIKELNKIYHNMALEYYSQTNFKEAINTYNQILALNPKDASALTNLGVSYYAISNFEQSEHNYLKAININPNDANIHYNLGITYKAQGNNDLATKEFKKACDLGYKASCQ